MINQKSINNVTRGFGKNRPARTKKVKKLVKENKLFEYIETNVIPAFFPYYRDAAYYYNIRTLTNKLKETKAERKDFIVKVLETYYVLKVQKLFAQGIKLMNKMFGTDDRKAQKKEIKKMVNADAQVFCEKVKKKIIDELLKKHRLAVTRDLRKINYFIEVMEAVYKDYRGIRDIKQNKGLLQMMRYYYDFYNQSGPDGGEQPEMDIYNSIELSDEKIDRLAKENEFIYQQVIALNDPRVEAAAKAKRTKRVALADEHETIFQRVMALNDPRVEAVAKAKAKRTKRVAVPL